MLTFCLAYALVPGTSCGAMAYRYYCALDVVLAAAAVRAHFQHARREALHGWCGITRLCMPDVAWHNFAYQLEILGIGLAGRLSALV